MKSTDLEKLNTLVAEENRSVHQLLSEWAEIDEKNAAIRHALCTVSSRGTALRLLAILGNDIKMAVFPELIDLASVGHSDVALCRMVIKSLPREWLLKNIENAMANVLARSEDEETYRRFAELLRDIDDKLVKSLVSQARRSSDAGIREFVDDFTPESR